MKKAIRTAGFAIWLLSTAQVAQSQELLDRKLKVYFDCSKGCDDDFVRSKIKLVDFVLDRLAADVHVLITAAQNGAGGYNFQLIFFGQKEFSERRDTLYCNLPANVTQVEAREKVLRTMQAGLVPFLVSTRYFDQLQFGMQEPAGVEKKPTEENKVVDKWNYWVFNAGVDGSVVMDEVYSTRFLKGNIGVNRTTPEQRVSFSMSGSNTGSSYKVGTGESQVIYKVVNTDFMLYHSFVSSINDHWSWAYNASFSSNSFKNIRHRKYVGAGVEYAIFPYSQVNTRFFTINYKLEMQDNFYFDSTIYNRMNEILPGHRLEAFLSIKQKWGNLSASLAYTNLAKDHLLNNLNYDINFDFRITGGLFMYIYSSGALVHDQIYLAKGKASAEDVLTKRRQLKSGFNFYSGMGLNFRFGSMMNNFVNRRFPGN